MSRLRVGVVGAGNIATIAQLPTLVQRPDVELAALVSRRDDPGPLQRRWGFNRVFRTVPEALDAGGLDALFVLTPRGEHASAVEAGLRAGIDVFCEKPLASTVDDARKLADLADETGRILMVGFNRRFAPSYEAGRLAFGASGVDLCVAQKNRAGSEYRATFENAIHMIDLLRWYCGGEPVRVAATAYGDDPWQEDGLSAHITFSTGSTGILVAARNAGAWSERLEAYGKMTTARIEAPDSVAITAGGVTTVRTMSAEAYGWSTATQTLGFAQAVGHFLDRVADREQPLTSGREALRTQELLDLILETAGLPTQEQPGREWTSHAQR
ncbi:Gfo/Idh/MocA family oxidoreductase [Actinoplanes bogorensis]|uniref:Gfo/Idh/MocA family oxidoreductase n=1 Tax=Paractinoplanes bogorensis TaxID=1610840 RepID=A0ABS5Z3I7_9ACTN|nr:Gfo/Idh/MocA family oxidoreductase [Actinoplanes bogorensis]MBU2670202.1 Gfo/Idh/MocA family oxidoreductase [Actinoplanes bogorensis]